MSDYQALISNRETMYRFLGRLYKIEVDQPLFNQLKGMGFPAEPGGDQLGAGYRMLEQYLGYPWCDPLTDLGVDYARVFLGAGISNNSAAAYPYESVYTSRERMIMQDARDQVVAAYRAKGLDKEETLDFPEDHIALELEFMARLCQETQHALTGQDDRALLIGLKEQRDFLSRHLLNWVPAFCEDVEKFSRTEFYKAVAQITESYLSLDHAIVDDMIAEREGEGEALRHETTSI